MTRLSISGPLLLPSVAVTFYEKHLPHEPSYDDCTEACHSQHIRRGISETTDLARERYPGGAAFGCIHNPITKRQATHIAYITHEPPHTHRHVMTGEGPHASLGEHRLARRCALSQNNERSALRGYGGGSLRRRARPEEGSCTALVTLGAPWTDGSWTPRMK